MASHQWWTANPLSPVTPHLVPDEAGDSRLLRNVTRFDTIAHLYTRTTPKLHAGVYNSSEVDVTIFLFYEDNCYPPLIVLDTSDMVRAGNRDHSLRFMEEETRIGEVLRRLPKKIRANLISVLERHGWYMDTDDEDWDLYRELAGSMVCLEPINKLKSPECLRDMDWPGFVHLLTEWEFHRDPRLVLAQKAHLLRGIEPRANPHALIVTNGGTGKSSFYSVLTGKIYDKVTRNSLLGYARGPDEIYPGTLDGAQLAVAIDQVESGEWGILDTVFNLMEFGEARVSSGAVELNITCVAPIVLLGNVREQGSAEKGLEIVLNHLTENPNIGRRLGVLIYGDDYVIIEGRSSRQRWLEWEKNAQFYRAVEEYALPRLQAIYQDPRLWEYLGEPIKGYTETIKRLIQTMAPGLVKTFVLEHGKGGQSRVRAAALNVSLVEHLDKIALDEYDLDEILDYARELTHEFTQINLESMRNLVENISGEVRACSEAYYRAQPEYVQIIIEAVEYARMQGILGDTFYLSSLDYSTDSEAYPWLSTCAQAIMRKKRGKALLNRRLREFYGFTFEPREEGLQIILEKGFHADLSFLDVRGLSWEASRASRVTRATIGLESLETLEETPSTGWMPTESAGQQGLGPHISPEPRDPDDKLTEMLKEVAFTFQERNHSFISTGQAREHLGWEADLFKRVLRKCLEEHKASGTGLRLTREGGLNLVW